MGKGYEKTMIINVLIVSIVSLTLYFFHGAGTDIVVNSVSIFFILLGLGFFLGTAVGLIRFPDFYTRTHAASITDTLGAGLVLLGLLFQSITMMVPGEDYVAGSWIIFVKLLMVGLFILLTAPTSGHALVKAAYAHGLVWTNTEVDDNVSN